MSAEPKTKAPFGEARRQVIDHMKACDVGARAIELADSDELDSLKTAEYALLAPIVTSGLAEYLSKAEPSKIDDTVMFSPNYLSDLIGREIGSKVIEQLKADPHRHFIEQLAKQRADLLPYRRLVSPVEGVLRSAANFSASQMYNVVISNALTIYEAGGMAGRPRQDFIAAVKRSHQLALSAPIVHLEWIHHSARELVNHGIGLMDNKPSLNNEALVYDKTADKAVLVRPLEKWTVTPRNSPSNIEGMSLHYRPEDDGLPIAEHEPLDAKIGCPVSFNPALVKRYYEHVVDMIEAHQSWPGPLADMREIQRRQMEDLAEMGLVPGARV